MARSWTWVSPGAPFPPDPSTVTAVRAALVDAGWRIEQAVPVSVALLDTADGRLHRARARLARVVTTGRSPTSRLELAQPPSPPVTVTCPSSGASTTLRPIDLPRGPVRDRLTRLSSDRALLARARFTSRRAEGALDDPSGALAATCVVHEQLRATGPGTAPAPASTELTVALIVELEARTGHPRALDQTAALLDALGGHASDGDTGSLVLALLGIDPDGPGPGTFLPLDPAGGALDAIASVCAALAAAADANWQGAVDDVDAEFLHLLRVALRRTRSVLRMAKGVVDDATLRRHSEALRWLAGTTSRPRDLDVLVAGWPATLEQFGLALEEPLEPVLAHLVAHREQAHDQLRRDLCSPRARDVVDAWRAWWSHPAASAGPRAAEPIGQVVAQRVHAAHRRMVRDGSAITIESPSERVHDLRKDAKQLRYELECFGGMFPVDDRERVVRRLARLQDTLGEYQDADVLAAELVDAAEHLTAAGVPSATIVALGELRGRLLVRAAEVRTRLAADIERFDSPSTRKRLDALLATVGHG